MDTAYCIEQLKALCAIDSPSGFTDRVGDYLMEELARLGYSPEKTRKGGVRVCLGGEGDGLFLMAHVDTLGAVVQTIKANGRLVLSPVGGLQPENCETENCRVYTRRGRLTPAACSSATPRSTSTGSTAPPGGNSTGWKWSSTSR